MNFCPKCGTALVPKMEGGRERPSCPACNYIFFGEFSIGCGGVVIRDGKVLLIRRGLEPGRGWWQIPGGYVEHDEVVADAVVREVKEEASVNAKVVDVLGFRHSVGGKGSIGGPSTNVYIVFRLEPLDAADHEPHGDGDEVTGAGYFTLDEVMANERVQNLSKWAIQRALLDREGFVHSQMGTDPNRPGWTLFGLRA